MNLAQLTQSCAHCALRHQCLPQGLSADQQQAFERIVQRPPQIRKGETLIRAGDPFEGIVMVRSGSLKVVHDTEQGAGKPSIVGFALAGERFGLGAMALGYHTASAVAMETTSVCRIDRAGLDHLVTQHAAFRHHLMSILSERIATDERRMALLGQGSAEQRLAAFLLSLSERFYARGLMADRFRLSMSRAGIAECLGLTRETITRLFAQFRQQKVTELTGRDLEILDPERLRQLAGVSRPSLSRTA